MASHGDSGATYQAKKGTTQAADFWSKKDGDPNKKSPAPAGWDWVPVRNEAGVFVGYQLVRDKSEGKGGGDGGGGGGTGGGASYSAARAGLSQYIQRYRLMFDNASVSPPRSLLKQAEAGNWSGSYWDMMVRLKDPHYIRSAEAKQRLAELRTYWKAVLPGTKVNTGFAKDYLRHGWTATQLQNQIMRRPEAQKLYPHWQAFMRAQREQGAAKAVNPLQYKAYASGFADIYKQAGRPAPKGYEKLFFKSGLSDDEFAKNYSALAETRTAARWDVGGVTEQQQRAQLFNGKGANQVRGLLQQALNKQQRFMQAQRSPYRVAEQDNILTLKGI